MTFLLWIFLLLQDAAVSLSQVQLLPAVASVLRGSNVSFTCGVDPALPWLVMSFMMKDSVVLTISRTHGVLNNNQQRFSAANLSSPEWDSWQFSLLAVERRDAGMVSCDLQNIEKVTATLSVQVSGWLSIPHGNVSVTLGQTVRLLCDALAWYPEPQVSWNLQGGSVDVGETNSSSELWGGDVALYNTSSEMSVTTFSSLRVDCTASVPAMTDPLSTSVYLHVVPGPAPVNHTVVIAVTVSVVSVALLVLLIIAIIFCCRRRRAQKSSYEEEVRRKREQTDRSSQASDRHGTENLGFAADSQTAIASSQKDSGFNQSGSFSNWQIPIDTQRHTGSSPTHLYSGLKKLRHATIV